MDTYNVNINFVEYYGIISAISPNHWKQIILDENIKLDRMCNEIVEKINAENKPCYVNISLKGHYLLKSSIFVTHKNYQI